MKKTQNFFLSLSSHAYKIGARCCAGPGLDRTLLKNFLSLLFSNFSVQGLRFVTVLFLARKLSTDDFGFYNYILVLFALSSIVVEFGLKNFAIMEFSQGRGDRQLMTSIFKIRSFVAFFAFLIILSLAFQAYRNQSYLLMAAVFGLSLFIDAFLSDFVAIAQEKLHLQALSQFIQAGSFLGFSFLFLNSNQGLLGIGISFFLSHILYVMIYFLMTKSLKDHRQKTEVVEKKIIATVKAGAPFLIATLMATFQSQMDIFLLGQFHLNFLIPDYSAALKALAIPLGVVSSLVAALQPRLAKNSNNKEKVKVMILKYQKLLLVASLSMVIVCFIFSKEIIHILFGEKFFVASLYLGPLSLVTAAFILTLLPMHALFVSHDTKKLLSIVGVNVAASLLFISTLLFISKPEWLPWGMLTAQMVSFTQAWRYYLKK